MAKRLNPEYLMRCLAPFGFALNLPEATKGGISFVRPSAVARLYEHVRISTGTAVYVEAIISGATFTSCHACVSEKDDRFRIFMSGNWPHASRIETSAAAKVWQERLVENADSFCKQMAIEIGPSLAQRLQPVFAAVDLYIQRFGDMFALFDREFAFVSEVSSEEQSEVDRLAINAGQFLYLEPEDAKLASLALVRFGSQVEGVASPFQNKVPRRDNDLSARLIVLAEYTGARRREYNLAGGLQRR